MSRRIAVARGVTQNDRSLSEGISDRADGAGLTDIASGGKTTRFFFIVPIASRGYDVPMITGRRVLSHFVASVSAVAVFFVINLISYLLIYIMLSAFSHEFWVDATSLISAYVSALVAAALTYRRVLRWMAPGHVASA
jgi:hypothetical protein